MVCKKCGKVNNDSNTFCCGCGAVLNDTYKPLAIVLVIAGIVISAAIAYVFIFGGDIMSGSSRSGGGTGGGGGGGGGGYIAESTMQPESVTPASTALPTARPTPTAQPTATPRPAATAAPRATAAPTPTAVSRSTSAPESVLSVPYYTVYENTEYGFSGIYPVNFQPNPDSDAVFEANSPGGTACIIYEVYSAVGTTPAEEVQYYRNIYGSSVNSAQTGSDFYAVSITEGDTSLYAYCQFKHGYAYLMMFENPAVQDQIYSRYINDICEEFTIE